jgi:hypothetical protein
VEAAESAGNDLQDLAEADELAALVGAVDVAVQPTIRSRGDA